MSGPVPAAPIKKKRRRRHADDDQFRSVFLHKPPNQEKLSAEELKEEFIRTLTTFDPLKPKNTIVWNYNENAYVPLEEESHFITLFSMRSELVDRTLAKEEMDPEEMGELIDDISDKEGVDTSKTLLQKNVKPSLAPAGPKLDTTTVKEEEPEEAEEEKDEQFGDGQRKFINQFNFCDRATQTDIRKTREHSQQTEDAVKSNYRDICNLWLIFDAYKADAINIPAVTDPRHNQEHLDNEEPVDNEQAEKAKEKEHPKKDEAKVPEKGKVKLRKASYTTDGHQVGGGDQVLLKAVDGLRLMERLIGSNVFEDVIDDFKYYEDGADEYREPNELVFGTLLPLWKFTYDKAKKMHVTCISWSQAQPDMFAVSYGSFNFTHPVRNGLVVMYSLRNSTYPEFVWTAPKGAMSCHIHPTKSSLVAIGLYDGNVGVLNLERDYENKSQTDILRNVPTVLKHAASVWSVKWGPDDIDGSPTFYSAGMDGKFIQWVVGIADIQSTGGLVGNELATFYLPSEPVPGPDGTGYKLFGCARALAFNLKDQNIFLVGTAEGKIFKCSALYASKIQTIFNAHFLPVSALEWNHYHGDIFISSSEDWTIKIWDQNNTSPMYVFEVGVGIMDVSWAPYSSTVFTASTEEGKVSPPKHVKCGQKFEPNKKLSLVLVYDLVINKERPVCSQQVVTKKKIHPHRIQFNPLYPIVVVGDDRGGLMTLKLSPNLRTVPKDSRNVFYLEGEARVQFEIDKLKKLLSLVRDPKSLTRRKTNENVQIDKD